jgi:hypothetical protein
MTVQRVPMIIDHDGNGVITKAELLKILKANHMASHDSEVARKADTIMAQADKDGDGVGFLRDAHARAVAESEAAVEVLALGQRKNAGRRADPVRSMRPDWHNHRAALMLAIESATENARDDAAREAMMHKLRAVLEAR